MKQKKYISFFVILVGLFWLFGTIGVAFSKNQPAEKQKDKSQTEISAYQVKAVVPVMASAVLTPSYTLIFEVCFLIANSSNQTFQKPIFKISFFEKVFEHLIAPQAP
ncbi:MAG: hypothetical protein ACK40K_04710 [Raineya sp.]